MRDFYTRLRKRQNLTGISETAQSTNDDQPDSQTDEIKDLEDEIKHSYKTLAPGVQHYPPPKDELAESSHLEITRAPNIFDEPADPTKCACGEGPHPRKEGRCAAGHTFRNNGLALVTGEQSRAFWREAAAARQEIADSLIRDLGHTVEEAPRALTIAADSVAQATLLRDSAYARMVETGGPLSSSGRTRRAFVVWAAALDRLERHLRLIGLERRVKPAPTVTEIMREVRDAQVVREETKE